jgi:N-acetylmuramoyl-L-alanine amidase
MSTIKETQTILHGPHIHSATLRILARAFNKQMSQAEADLIASAYTAYGELTNIGNLLPFAQAAKETAWFASERWVKSFNPAGLGATNDGAWGGHFDTVAAGVIAQYAHILAYAVKPSVAGPVQKVIRQLDPRLDALSKVEGGAWIGGSPRWIDLNGKWAHPGGDYGQSIIKRANELLNMGAFTNDGVLTYL